MARRVRTFAHWGASTLVMEGERITDVLPFEHDPQPTPLITALPEMVRSPQRIATPMVRAGWLRGRVAAGRGDDDFVAVDWDSALALVAGEIGRVRQEYGNAAIFGGSYGWGSAGRLHQARGLLHRFLNGQGGFTGQTTNYSFGAAMTLLPHLVGNFAPAVGLAASWPDICAHTDLLLAFGGLSAKNWQVQSGGAAQHRHGEWMARLAAGKTELVNISPCRFDVADPDAAWLAIRPNTDAALIMALTQEIIAAGAADAAFLARCCVGFDPYRAYLDGESDGVAKDAAWAGPITGIAPEDICSLAQRMIGRRVLLSASWSLQRASEGEQPYWALVALAAVLGQIGLPGGGFAFGYGSANGIGQPRYLPGAVPGIVAGRNPMGPGIPVARIADCLLHPGQSVRCDGALVTYPQIRLVYWAGGNPFHHHQDLARLRRAFAMPQTIIVQDSFWTATARHADIVLPATTSLERNDIGASAHDPFIMAMQKAIDPVGQARDDFAIFADLAARLGVGENFTGGRDEAGWLRAIWADFGAELARGLIATPDFDSFWEQGFFRIPEPPPAAPPFAAFRADPQGSKLATPSGRIEIFSETIAGFALAGQPGHACWRPPAEWLGAPAASRFPLHLLTPQPAGRLHGQMDLSAPSLAEKSGGLERVRVNPADAAARGIGQDDLVRLENDRGACLARADLTKAIRPGVLSLPTGSGFAPLPGWENGPVLDRRGNPNVLTLDVGTSELTQGCAAQSCLVELVRHLEN